jgi:hypothetical protein
MRVRFDQDGSVEIRGLDPIQLDTLRRIPELLDSDDPRVRERLLPAAYDDPEDERQWRGLVGPDLEHLVASRGEIVRKDLRGVVPDEERQGFRMSIPAEHRSAWEAAITGASHALYLLSGLHPEDTEVDPGELGDPVRDLGLLRIRILGWLLAELLDLDGYE